MNDQRKAIERARKALALAASTHSEHEAATARATADRVLAAAGLTLADLEPPKASHGQLWQLFGSLWHAGVSRKRHQCLLCRDWFDSKTIMWRLLHPDALTYRKIQRYHRVCCDCMTKSGAEV
jgi:hypothetical protein